MAGKIGRKQVLKFRDFPTRYHGEAFFVEKGYDEELNLSIINHLVEIKQLFDEKYIHFYYFPFLASKIKKAAPYCYPALNKKDLNFSVPSDFLLSRLVDEKDRERFRPSILHLDHVEDGIYYVNAYPLSIEEDEDLMPLMQKVCDKLPNCRCLASSIGECPYNPFDPIFLRLKRDMW